MAPMTTVDETIYPYPNAVARFPRLRQSMLAQFDRCPLSAKFGLDYERGWSTHDQARGQLAHRTWAKCLEEMARNGESKIEVDVALAILYEVLRQHDVDARDVVALPAEQIADLRMSVIKWAYDSEFRIEDLVDVEQRLQATITYPSEYGPVERTLTGQLDALFAEGPTRAVVLDWKDTWGMPPESGISFQGYFQQRHYGFLVMENYRAVQTVVLREHYPRYGEYREATVDRDSLEDIRAELSALAERFDRCMEQDIFRPAPGKHCSYCPRPSACPIFPEVRGEGAIQDAEHARRVAAQLVVARTASERWTRALKAYANIHGPIPVADAKGRRQFGYVRSQSTQRPSREDLERALQAAGGRPIRVDDLYRERVHTRFEEHTPESGVEITPEDARLAEALRSALGDT
jgi:hypothetical protein